MSNPWLRFAPAVCCFALVAAGCDRRGRPRFFAFTFDSHTPLATATGYTLHSVAPKKP